MAARGAPVAETLPLAVRAARLEPGEIDHSLTALRLAAQGGGVREARAQAEALLARSRATTGRRSRLSFASWSNRRRPLAS